jgi:hypothetical protein
MCLDLHIQTHLSQGLGFLVVRSDLIVDLLVTLQQFAYELHAILGLHVAPCVIA